MCQKNSFRNLPIISLSISVTYAMAAIWFSPAVEISSQTQSGADSANYDIIAFDDFANEYSENTQVYFHIPPSRTASFGHEL